MSIAWTISIYMMQCPATPLRPPKKIYIHNTIYIYICIMPFQPIHQNKMYEIFLTSFMVLLKKTHGGKPGPLFTCHSTRLSPYTAKYWRVMKVTWVHHTMSLWRKQKLEAVQTGEGWVDWNSELDTYPETNVAPENGGLEGLLSF